MHGEVPIVIGVGVRMERWRVVVGATGGGIVVLVVCAPSGFELGGARVAAGVGWPRRMASHLFHRLSVEDGQTIAFKEVNNV